MLVLVGKWPMWNLLVIIVVIMHLRLLFLLGHNIVPYLCKSVFTVVIIINVAAIGFGV